MPIRRKKSPAYARISEEIAAKIRNGALSENEQLPTERDLCEQYDVSRITIRHALALLEQGGLIRKQQGRGIFVAPQRYEHEIGGLYMFANTCEMLGARHRREVISMEQCEVVGEIAKSLGMFDRSMCCVIKYRCWVEDQPYAYRTSYVPLQLLAQGTKEGIEQGGIYDQIRKSCGLVRDKTVEWYEAVMATSELLTTLDRRGPLALMQVERVSYSGQRPIEYMMCYFVGDKIRLRLTAGASSR